MKTILVVILSLFCFSQATAAGSVSNAKVINIRVDLDGKIMLVFDKPIGGAPPTCVHDAYKNALAVDTKIAGGR